MHHVLVVRRGQDRRTRQPQWEAWMPGGKLFILNKDSREPEVSGEIWLCEEVSTISQNEKFTLKSVMLVKKLLDPDLSVEFIKDKKQRFNVVLNELSYPRVICFPDKNSRFFPTDKSTFWICRFKGIVECNLERGFVLIALDLLMEDDAARENKAAALREAETQRQAQEARRKEDREKWEREREEQKTGAMIAGENIVFHERRPSIGGGAGSVSFVKPRRFR
jgi:hypothetical protein